MSDDDTAYCFEDGCTEAATLERPEGMTGDTLVVYLVCGAHGPEWLR